ncbi:hypothetical protein ACNKHU_15745 [Shigella flexneri]
MLPRAGAGCLMVTDGKLATLERRNGQNVQCHCQNMSHVSNPLNLRDDASSERMSKRWTFCSTSQDLMR